MPVLLGKKPALDVAKAAREWAKENNVPEKALRDLLRRMQLVPGNRTFQMGLLGVCHALEGINQPVRRIDICGK